MAPATHRGREVSCRPNGFYFRAMEEQGHPPELLLEGIGLPRERVCDPRARLDWKSFRRLMANLGRVWSDDELVEAGKKMAVSRWVQPFAAIARTLLTSEDIYRWTMKPGTGVAHQMFTCIVHELEETAPGRLVISATMRPGYAPSRELFLMFRGSLTSMPRLLGLDEARVEMRIDDGRATYDVTLPPSGGLATRIRRLIRRPRTLRSAAVELQRAREELFARADESSWAAGVRATADAAIKESESRFYKGFHASPMLMLISDFEGRLHDVNEAFVRGSGYRREELMGRNLAELDFWKDRELRRRALDRLAAGKPLRGLEGWFVNRDGEEHCALVSAEIITVEGERRIFWQALDITRQRRLEAELFQAQRLEALGRLAGGVAHDFNNLLTAISSQAEMLLERLGDREADAADVREILRASERGAALTRQLLAFGRKQLLQPRLLDLNQVVRGLATLLERTLGESILVVYELAPDLGRVRADPGEMEQVLLNLAVNARDAMPGGGSLTLATGNAERVEDEGADAANGGRGGALRRDPARPGRRRADLGAVALPGVEPAELSAPEGADTAPEEAPGSSGWVRLTVSDDGRGMDAETRRRIFEPFFSTKAAGEGSGLGLASVYGMVRQSGGRIRVTSAPGRGSRFDVYLPRAADDAEGAGAAEARGAAPETAPGPGRRDPAATPESAVVRGSETVLLVEDDPRILRLSARALTAFGYRVLEARDAAAALEAIDRGEPPVDIVVSDVVMPAMSGVEFAAEVARRSPGTRLLLVSGYSPEALPADPAGGLELPFLAKPFTPRRLAARIREILDGDAG